VGILPAEVVGMPPEPRREDEEEAAAPLGPPPEPEVRPQADDPVREHTIGEDPLPAGPDPRLRVDFF
jgi:hypothetical protein